MFFLVHIVIHTLSSGPVEDNHSVDGSEHSLHIDLADDPMARSQPLSEGGSTSPFQQYANAKGTTNPGILL